MSTRDRIEEAVNALLKEIIEEAVNALLKEIAEAIDDEDLTSAARDEMIRLHGAIYRKLQAFNKPTGPDSFTDGGPTREDQEGTVRHDIG